MTARKTDARRSDQKNAIWEYLMDTFTTTNGATATQEVVFNDSPGGIVTRILLSVNGTNTNGKGATLTLDDVDGFEIFNSGIKAEDAPYVMDVDVPYVGALTIKMAPEGDPGATGQTVTVKLMGE
jgi:hypothetical protein